MQTITEALIEAINQEPTEESKRAFLTNTLIELSTAFEGKIFVKSVKDMQEYWAEQAEING